MKLVLLYFYMNFLTNQCDTTQMNWWGHHLMQCLSFFLSDWCLISLYKKFLQKWSKSRSAHFDTYLVCIILGISYGVSLSAPFRLKALIAIPKVQPRFALAIWKKYPTMKSLLTVYMDPSKSVSPFNCLYFSNFTIYEYWY